MGVVPAARMAATPTIIAVFAFVHAISFNAPLTRVKVELEAVAPLVITTAVIDFTNPSGAAWTALVEIAPAITDADKVTPRLTKNLRNFSTPRLTRVLAVSSPTPDRKSTRLNSSH